MIVSSRDSDLDTLEALLQGPQTPHVMDGGGRTPLLETGVDCAASDGETPSYIAAQQGHVEMV